MCFESEIFLFKFSQLRQRFIFIIQIPSQVRSCLHNAQKTGTCLATISHLLFSDLNIFMETFFVSIYEINISRTCDPGQAIVESKVDTLVKVCCPNYWLVRLGRAQPRSVEVEIRSCKSKNIATDQ